MIAGIVPSIQNIDTCDYIKIVMFLDKKGTYKLFHVLSIRTK